MVPLTTAPRRANVTFRLQLPPIRPPRFPTPGPVFPTPAPNFPTRAPNLPTPAPIFPTLSDSGSYLSDSSSQLSDSRNSLSDFPTPAPILPTPAPNVQTHPVCDHPAPTNERPAGFFRVRAFLFLPPPRSVLYLCFTRQYFLGASAPPCSTPAVQDAGRVRVRVGYPGQHGDVSVLMVHKST